MKYKTLILPIFLSLQCLATSCAGTRVLIPAPSSSIKDNKAVQDVKGVHVAVTGEGWTGDPGVPDKITPLRVTIENKNGSALRVAYSLFSLVDAEGNRYSALPPYSIRGDIHEWVTRSDFTCSGFFVAPYYSRFYPYLESYEGSFFYDPFYFDHYYSWWKDTALPTKKMIDLALPEGVLWNDSSVTGFLYFEKISESSKYRFKMELVDITNGARFGEINIPLVLKEK